MSKSQLWAVLAPDQAAYDLWARNEDKLGVKDLQRCKMLRTMLDVYRAQHTAVEVICLKDWREFWSPAQLSVVKRRLQV